MQFFSRLILAAASVLLVVPAAGAQESSKAKPAAKKAAAKKTPAKKAKKQAVVHEDDQEPDLQGTISIDYDCELGNKLTIYRNVADTDTIAMRWKKRLLRLKRVATTTGANRFENVRNGWVWIDIPAKGMLLDAKHGRQLANECITPEQALIRSAAQTTTSPGLLETPAAVEPVPAADAAVPVPATEPAAPVQGAVPGTDATVPASGLPETPAAVLDPVPAADAAVQAGVAPDPDATIPAPEPSQD